LIDPKKDHQIEAIQVIEECTKPTKIPRLWSARSLSQRWQVSRALIYRLHKQGRLPGLKLLGVLRFREEDLIQLLHEEGLHVE